MKRRKKSILFSATLATAGLVAGSLIAINNNTISAETIRSMSLDQLTDILSNELKVSATDISTSLDTKEIIIQVDDENILKNDPLIVNYGVIYKNYYGVTYNSARDAAASYYLLRENDAVKNISLNYNMSVSRTAPSNSANDNYGVDMMRLDRYADDLASSTNELTIAVIDSGINSNHELFSESSTKDRLDLNNAISFVNATSNDSQCQYEDDVTDEEQRIGHGTAVAGLIAQSTPKNVKIVPIKVFGPSGSGPMKPILCGATYAAEVLHADVVNMSLGLDLVGIEGVDQDTIDLYNSIFDDFAEESKSIFVAAAGNEGETLDRVSYPAMAPAVIAVSSVDRYNNFSPYSQYGEGIDFAAPGQSMKIACRFSSTCYDVQSGTSFSSPLLASAVADILVEHPDYTKDQVMSVLKANAEDYGAPGYDIKYGYGSVSFRINRYADITFNSVALPSKWGTSANVTVSASSTEYSITKYALLEGNVETAPTTWSNVSSAGSTITETYNLTKNGTYTLWYKNSGNEVKRKVFTLSMIDKVAPTINENLSASAVSEDSEKLTITVSDDASGIEKIEWNYKLTSASDYTKVTDNANGETNATVKNHTLSSLAPGSYTAFAKVYDKAGNLTASNNVSFTIEAPADHVTIGNPTGPTSWVKTNATISVAVSSNISNITHRAVVSGNSTTEPTGSAWVAVSTPSKSFTDTFEVSENGTYTVWYKNDTESSYKTFAVNKIDKVAPVAKNIATSNLTGSSAKVSVTVSDNASGIEKIEWYYKLVSAESYTTKTSTYTDGATAETTKTYTLTGLTAGDYVVYAKVYDNVELSASTGEINFTIEEAPEQTDHVSISNVQVPATWSKKINVAVTVASEVSNITHRAVVSGSSTSAPAETEWVAISSPAKSLNDTVEISANGTYTVWYKNESGETDSESFTVNKVDSASPVIEEALSAAEPEGKNITLSISVEDAASGIAKIEWYYKLEGAEGFAVEVENYSAATVDSVAVLAVTPKTHTFADLAPGNYVAYAKIYDNVGNTTTTDEITFTIAADPTDDNTDDGNGNSGTGEAVTNPKTDDGIAIISSIAGVILAAGAIAFAKLRRIR